jgi:hypothetical protein
MLNNEFKKSAIEKLKSMDSNKLKKAFKEIGSESETNEEWFSGMYTEAKAEWLADHMKCSKCPQQNRCNGYHGGCVALMLEWLKQPHQGE